MNNLTVFEYQGRAIQVREPDKFCNLTQMCQAGGKKAGDFLRLESTKAYILELESTTGITAIDCKVGGLDAKGGTWGHKLLAIRCAQWISPKFAVWCDAHIFNLMQTGQTNLAIDPLEEMRLKIELAKIESQKETAITSGKQADLQLIQFRHIVTTTMPEPVQQKILGYSTIKTTEYVDRTILPDGSANDGVGITYIQKRYGFKSTKEAWGWLERIGLGKFSDKWKHELKAVESSVLPREYIQELDTMFDDSPRQKWLGE
jgi:hypothetical protein